MAWLQNNLRLVLLIVGFVFGGIFVVQIFAHWNQLCDYGKRLQLFRFFSYHSGHGRHAVANRYVVGI